MRACGLYHVAQSWALSSHRNLYIFPPKYQKKKHNNNELEQIQLGFYSTILSGYNTHTGSVINCYIVITSPPWPIYCLTPLILPHLHMLYIYIFSYCIIDCMFIYSMCNSVMLFVPNCFALSWPGRSCK